MSKLTLKMLNLLFTEAEQKGKTRDFRVVIGPGSDGSSTDKLSLDLGFNPWDTAITHRSEWHSVSKTVFTQHEPSGSWCTEQSDVWLDDVKTFYHRPIRCAPNIHPHFPAQRDTDLLAEHAQLSCAKTCIDVSSCSPDLYRDKHATLHGRRKNEISSSETFVKETKQVTRNLLTNTILYGRTITYMKNSAIGAVKRAVGYSFRILDLWKERIAINRRFIDEIEVRVCLGRSKHQFSLYINPGQRQREICRDVFTRRGSVTECERERRSDHHCGHTTHPEKVRTENCSRDARQFLPRRRNTTRTYSWHPTKLG